MIIDVHGHTTAPQALYGYNYRLIANRGDFGRGDPGISDADIEQALERHLALLGEYGIDLQLIPPRPWGIPNAETSEKIVRWMAGAANDLIARQVKMYPDHFRGMAALPQTAGVSPANCTEELERCIAELGFVGCMINPDPGEGMVQTPGMGEEFWYPLYEKMVELDVPGLVHTGGCRTGRESQSEHFITEESIAALSVLRSPVFRDFPSLKLIIAHGGGSLPYQVGRYRGSRAYLAFADKEGESFDDRLRKLYFDTVLYNQESLELLIRIAGAENCLFGTDTPGTGSATDPATGRPRDDLKPVIENIEWLSEDQRGRIFAGNARQLFPGLA